jgi:argonaute-like protein implicated in RNA metabolism and viral defense
VESDESPSVICSEILALTKMNWNNTQFDGKYPITLQCARRVGDIMKYLGENDAEPQISYSFYM